MLDFILELGSSVPWIYRPWLFCFSKDYRRVLKLRWQKDGLFYKSLDIFMSLLFGIAELGLLYCVFI